MLNVSKCCFALCVTPAKVAAFVLTDAVVLSGEQGVHGGESSVLIHTHISRAETAVDRTG